MAIRSIIEQQNLAASIKNFISYDPDSGLLEWKPRKAEDFNGASSEIRAGQASRWNKLHAGQPALTYQGGKGYLSGSIHNRSIHAHVAAWVILTGNLPKNTIDHINGIRSDNRAINLRDVSITENLRNRKKMRSNTSGHTGVYFHKNTQKWHARIGVDGRHRHLGCFSSLSDAVEARRVAEIGHRYGVRHGI